MSEFKFTAAVTPQADVVVDAASKSARPATVPVAAVTPRDPSTGKLMDPPALDEFAIEAQSVTGTPRTDMCQILNLIEPPVWTAGRGHWRNATDGWLDSRADTVLTFDAARTLIDARIRELGLDRETVMAFPKRHFFFWQDWDAFNALTFEQRMEQFKSARS